LDSRRLAIILEKLTGETVPLVEALARVPLSPDAERLGLGYSQLNELLLIAGLDRITHAFFGYLKTGRAQYEIGQAFDSADELEEGVERFRKAALLLYGNVKFAFKSLSRDEDLLRADLESLEPIPAAVFESRHDPILPIERIKPEDAYLTGYIVEGEIDARLLENAEDEAAQLLKARRKEVVSAALQNQDAYLASDHLDVYVATSMRAKHEFLSVFRTVEKIFGDDELKELKLRWFDPTQAYCLNRIDKGLAEALMLRRASCTIYLAQETDTLGKDSELASTLAQGKPVIAFVPEVDEDFLNEHFGAIQEANPTRPMELLLLDQLQLFDPAAAWTDERVREWIARPEAVSLTELRALVSKKIKIHYDKRTQTLREHHPLGIQVNLGTGVANGVLVVRNTQDCARLVRRIVTRTLDFELVVTSKYTALRERISASVFRVMTADPMLTNTFWNFYLNPAQ
jgi:hypothetical protein